MYKDFMEAVNEAKKDYRNGMIGYALGILFLLALTIASVHDYGSYASELVVAFGGTMIACTIGAIVSTYYHFKHYEFLAELYFGEEDK